MKKLVAYFSASGVTKAVAQKLAQAANADLFEIVPQQIYTNADLNWRDKHSRSSVEMNDRACRPAIAAAPDVSGYDVIFVGYPVWWYHLPMIMQSFFDSYDFGGKTIIPFNAHAGSRDGGTYREIAALEPDASVLDGIAVAGERASDAEKDVLTWLAGLRY